MFISVVKKDSPWDEFGACLHTVTGLVSTDFTTRQSYRAIFPSVVELDTQDLIPAHDDTS